MNLLTIREVADQLSLAPKTVRKYIKAGALRGVRLGREWRVGRDELENWEYNDDGLMRMRFACINDLAIKEADRNYQWPLGRRPDGHPGLSELGL